MMYKKILVPLDSSRRAERILPYVEELAKKFESEIVLLQVVTPTYPYGVSFEPSLFHTQMNKHEKDAETYLAGFQGEFREKGIKAKVRVVIGSIVGAILSMAEAESVDLIAMASHGRGGLARVFYGSVAAGVLHQVDRPLLIVRSR